MTLNAVEFISISLLLTALYHPTFQTTTAPKTFCYEDPICGPTSVDWPGICQTGTHQSPIDISHTFATTLLSVLNPKPIHFKGYTYPEFIVLNNGHSVQVSFNFDLTSTSEMTGYGLETPYIFAQAHFHWGKSLNDGGSEHTINGKHYPMEIHLVHFSNKYSSYADAAESDGDHAAVSVLAVMVTPTDLVHPPVPALTLIADKMSPAFQNFTGGTLINEPIDLTPFLPKPGAVLYRYLGSLTTPPCSEVLQWTVNPDPVFINEGDYLKFHTLNDEFDHLMNENFRPMANTGFNEVELFSRAGFSSQ